jgi:asparagine synthase (glutamine-hydrolysing)
MFARHAAAPPVDQAELLRVRDAMAARGPDAAGAWLAPDGRVGLGHRRLAILDLDPRAEQPMVSACGRFRIVFNGEIYNWRALHRELEAAGAVLRTTSDTEVLLELWGREGPGCLERLRGMYAFAIWDAEERRLWLVRDPFGIKPLYYADAGRTLRAASQVKALLAGGAVSREVEPARLAGLFLRSSVPEGSAW